MNLIHHWLCRSDRWRRTVERRLPWALAHVDLGADVLELGPGPGLTTDLLRKRVSHLTAIEIDRRSAESLASRLNGSNVQVVKGDATEMPFANAQFSSGVCFTMLHHVHTPALQDQLFREVWRVLQPGGAFVGADSLQSLFMRLIHIRDTLVPVVPDTLGDRLQAAGFQVMEIEQNSEAFRFHARRPASS
ncbi:MAG: class I SAM-dependent methyltransferase [Candidatus Acidiferrales bacterium]